MPEPELTGEFQSLAAVQEDAQDELLAMSNVEGVALGHKITEERETGDPCLSVFVSQKLEPELLGSGEMIAPEIGKFKTDVVETGVIFAGATATPNRLQRAQRSAPTTVPVEPSRTDLLGDGSPSTLPDAGLAFDQDIMEEADIEVLRGRVRPALGGYSVGHFRVTAGTIATAVIDATPFPGIPRRYYILSNNHVLANSNAARPGDAILQPGRVDGGTLPADRIARLSRFVPIRFGGGRPNLVDAAIAEGQFHDLNREIFWIGHVRGVRTLNRIGDIVQKTGRTTNYSTGRVTNLNATVNVNYGGGRVARMVRQIVTTNMSAGGDSGSLLCDMQENAVGLLFAGSIRITIHNHITYVQRLLGIRVA